MELSAELVAQISEAIQRNTGDSSSASVQLLCRFSKPGGVGGRTLTTASGPISGTLIHAKLLSSRHALVQIPPAIEKLRPSVTGSDYRSLQCTQRFSMPLPTASRSAAAVAGESTPFPTTRKKLSAMALS